MLDRLLVPTPRRIDAALAVLRVVVGVIFLAHGWQKIFQFGFAGVSGGFAQMGIPLPHIAGPFVALLEFVGGIALILGVLTPVVSALFTISMLVAILVVHLENGFFLPGGIEFALMMMAGSLALVLGGAGAYSVDRALVRRGRSGSTGAEPPVDRHRPLSRAA